jgi:hypothetical protein
VQNTFASQDNPAAHAAKRYAQLDLIPILLRPNSKAPYLHSWPTLKLRTLLKHFQPDDNLGLRLGRQNSSGAIIAIDVDTRRMLWPRPGLKQCPCYLTLRDVMVDEATWQQFLKDLNHVRTAVYHEIIRELTARIEESVRP